MLRRHATTLALAVGLLMGLCLALAGQALGRTDFFHVLTLGRLPEAPAFPPRVVARSDDAEVVNEAIFEPLTWPYLHLMDAVDPSLRQGRDFAGYSLVRHRSLELSRHSGSLIEAITADALSKGWEAIPALTIDTITYYDAVAFQQNGYTFLVLGYQDGLMPRADNPGLSLEIASEADACIGSGELAPRTDSGLAPCPTDGFLPVVVWTDLPVDPGEQPWLHPDTQELRATDDVWGSQPSWEAFVATASDR